MIRFWDKEQFIQKNDKEIIIASGCIKFDQNTWDEGRDFFKHNICNSTVTVQMLPVVNGRSETVCYAYQDKEANRELRMLRELEKNREAMQFQDIYPEIRKVIVCGCNELAYYFVRYLKKQMINVQVMGKYWAEFGYEKREEIDADGSETLVIYAEDMVPKNGDFYQTVIRSVSAEFECIDRIYEQNVLKGIIKDAIGEFDQVVEKLNGKEIIILGTDEKAQDAYDFLYKHGIDISCFASRKTGETYRTLLGKKVVSIEEAICNGENRIFINAAEQNSALGTESVDFLDYYGFERNEQLFLIRDYADIACSNLIHVLKGKVVRLAGDEKLCAILAGYLKEVEQGDIDVCYIELSQCTGMNEDSILCIVNPMYDLEKAMKTNTKIWAFNKELSAKGIVSYTDYFSCTRAFALIDLYRNRGRDKYTIKQLVPKGILLGRIEEASGNIFLRGILDGHPDILKFDEYTVLNNNLFVYCIRLAEEKAENILAVFRKCVYEELGFRVNVEFTCWERFEESMGELLSLKEQPFTSQELFMIFHMAWASMMRGQNVTDISQKVIYWEPHHFPRNEFPFLAKWLESKQIKGRTISLHRDNIVWWGSCYKFYKEDPASIKIIDRMSRSNMVGKDDISCQYWNEFPMRFEDIKLHPKKELTKICAQLDIPWSDTMLKTTNNGTVSDYQGIRDFDIKPVFNKYEEFLSAFDRFRIALISSPYQKKYGYTYEDSMQFSRKELQVMFLKEFRFQKKLQFDQEKERKAYYIRAYQSLQKQLWEVRKHILLDDIEPEFGEVEIGENRVEEHEKQIVGLRNLEELKKLVQFVRQQKKLVLYGIGRDCEGILEQLSDTERSELLFSDLKAVYMEITFHGKKVLEPKMLCDDYHDYKILITSSLHYKTIQSYLESLGISSDRITCNMFQLWEEDK